MLNTECKQCHKKCHHDNAKYCSMCSKKLVSEPEFKVGDYVVELDNFITKVEEIDNCGVLKGVIYDMSEEMLTVSKYPVMSNKPRHATPEEIAEYESALTFQKHGRKPFEVKEGDILGDDVSVAVESFTRDMSEAEADLQEAKSSAKKLIEKIDEYLESLKPKFKVGDYVTVYVNRKEKIAKIDELTESNSKAHGLWYDRTLVNVKQDYWFTSGLNKFRHARPSEIAEYESALQFHEHGRNPFEVKKRRYFTR